MSEVKRRAVAVPEEGIFKLLFYLAHFVVPLTTLAFLFLHIYCGIDLTWQILILAGVGLLPFLLPLFCVYVGKIWEIELNDMATQGVVASGTFPPDPPGALSGKAPNTTTPSPTVESSTTPLGPDPNALTSAEKKMLRTLWKHQSRYISEGQPGLWGFSIRPVAPDYPEFVRGFNTLFERGIVMQNEQGLVFLTRAGIGYCQIFASAIDLEGEAWKQFVPAG
jgi:hypothetical protein